MTGIDLHQSILFSLIGDGKPTRAVPAPRGFQRLTDARYCSLTHKFAAWVDILIIREM